MVSNSRKKATQDSEVLNKSILFPLDRRQVSTNQNGGFVEKYVFTRCKSYFSGAVMCEENWREGFLVARNKVFISWNKVCHPLTTCLFRTQQRLPQIKGGDF